MTCLHRSYAGVSTAREHKEDRGDVGPKTSKTQRSRLFQNAYMVTSGSTRSACMKTGRQSSDMKLAKARQDCEKLIVHVFFKIRFDCVYCRSSTALCTVTSWHGGGSGSTLGCARILIVCHVLRIISRTGKSVRHLCSL